MRSFVQTPEAVAAATPADNSAPVATPPVANVPAPIPAAPQSVVVGGSAYVEGEVTRSDVKTPYLACVQSVGPKSVLNTPGTLLLGEFVLAQAPTPPNPTTKLRVMFSRVAKSYVENLKYDPTPNAPRPRVFKTQAEVAAVGGTTEWHGNVGPTFIPRCTSLVLVRAPQSVDDSLFSLIDGTDTYAPAMLMLQKTSYGAAKTLWTDLSLSLKGDPTATFYDLYWAKEQRGTNWVWVAKLVRVREELPSDSLRGMGKKLAGGNIEVVDDTE